MKQMAEIKEFYDKILCVRPRSVHKETSIPLFSANLKSDLFISTQTPHFQKSFLSKKTIALMSFVVKISSETLQLSKKMERKMSRITLTESRIKKAPTMGYLYTLKDTLALGLQVNINPKGKKVFYFRAFKITRKIGEALTIPLEEARETARQWRLDYIRGIDISTPKKEKNPVKPEITLNELVKKYIDFKSSGAGCFAPRTLRSYRYVWQKHAENGIGLLGVSKITDVMLNDLFESLKETYSNVNNLKKILVPAFKYGKAKGYPVPQLNSTDWFTFKGGKKERYFEPSELKKLNDIVDDYAAKNPPQQQSVIIKLLIHTGCRCSEILELKWQDIFFEEGYIQLSKTKTKKGRRIPLTSYIRDLLYRVSRTPATNYVFPALNNQDISYRYNTLEVFWKFFMEQGGFNASDLEKLTMHSLRHTYITAANRIKISPFTLQALAGHSTGRSVTARYIHHSIEELTEAQEAIIKALQSGAY